MKFKKFRLLKKTDALLNLQKLNSFEIPVKSIVSSGLNFFISKFQNYFYKSVHHFYFF